MLPTLPRRKRRVLFTVVIAAILLAVITTVVVLISFTPEAPYRPGENIAGLTSDLDRTIPSDYPRVRFKDVSAEAGLTFIHFSGRRTTQLPEDMGSGAAWADYDNDGWQDLFVVNMAGSLDLTPGELQASTAHCELYHNNGDGTFTEVSAAAGVDYRGWGMAAAWGDYDNDGWTDLFVTSYGENLLFKNNRDGTFSGWTKQAGLGGQKGFWAGASWADYDRDGFLDLYVCGYVKYTAESNQSSLQYDTEVPSSINPSSFSPERNLLYRNNHDGTFSEVAMLAGVADQNGRSLSAAWCDFNGDLWPDLYVANDVSDNSFFINTGDGKFHENGNDSWVSDYRGAMGIAVGDWDGDSDMDMFITHWIAQENALYSNLSAQFASAAVARGRRVKFADEADRYGLGQIALDFIGWGTSFFDYDNDGKQDLFVANGSTFQQKDMPWLLQPMPSKLFWDKGRQEGFFDVSSVSGEYFAQQYVGRGAAFADYDNDGDIDIFVLNNGGPGILLRNEGGEQKNWLKVFVQGRKSNRSAIGTKLRLVTGNSVQVQQVGAQSSYCSQNSLVSHFGVGTHSKVDTLEIEWLSGRTQIFTGLAANQVLSVIEGEGSNIGSDSLQR